MLPHDIEHAKLIAAEVAMMMLRECPPVVPEYLATPEAAVFLGVSEKILESRRIKETGPRYTKHGPRIVRYRVTDLHAWMEAGHVES